MKPTKATLQQRLDEILQIRLDGASFHDVRSYIAEKEAAGEEPWRIPEGGRPISERTTWRFVEKTNYMMAQTCKDSRKRLLRRHLAQRRNLYAKCVNHGDMRAALAALDSEAKLLGLFDDEITRLIAELQRQIEELKASGTSSDPKAAEANAG